MQPLNKSNIEDNVHIIKRMRLNEPDREYIISTANEILGINSWSHSVTRRDIDYIDCDNGRFTVGISVIVKVELKHGIYHEELGYGICTRNEDKGSAIALAQQNAATQGLRKALSSFGGELTNRLSESRNQKCRLPETEVQSCSPTRGVIKPSVDTSPSAEDEIKLERKRRQQKKREEFLQQMQQKQIQVNNTVSNEENGKDSGRGNNQENDFIGGLDLDDEAFISTQMDRMVQSAAAQAKPRIPLISSPSNTIIDASRSWVVPRAIKVNTPRNLHLAPKTPGRPI
ncbi:hypothetical protein L9F63_001918 [Diploptera punctata]|uniref:Uncharacterized protein n=1 Tax=Diploptera punctata TaxID=6984 RepID=A0AAD8A350_DIPPU|nr:hypothetical protein L9F63_001918 [Diploptera punctata]